MKRQVGKQTIFAMRVLLGLMLGASSAWAADPIKIGFSSGLSSGLVAAMSDSHRNGIQLAIEQVNAKGGVLGRPLELISQDNQSKPDLAASQLRDLILRDKVDFVVGPAGSNVAMTAATISKQYKKIVIYGAAGTPRLTGDLFNPYIFQTFQTSIMDARSQGAYVADQFSSFGFLGADYEYPRQFFKDMKAKVGDLKPSAKWVVEAWPKLGETDFSPYITQVLAAKPEVVILQLYGADLVAFVKQAKPFGFFDKTKVLMTLTYTDIKALGDDLPPGTLGAMHVAFWLGGPKMQDFVKLYNSKYGDFPSDFAIFGYELTEMLVQAVEKAKSIDSDAVVTALEQLNYDGPSGVMGFRKIDHQLSRPTFVGVLKKDDRYPFKILGDVKTVEAKETWPSDVEVEAMRKK